jgi:Cu/Ag efflux protein CusF
VSVTDELTLDKFKDKRIQEGDEIRARFEKKDGKNNSKTFKKTAGC